MYFKRINYILFSILFLCACNSDTDSNRAPTFANYGDPVGVDVYIIDKDSEEEQEWDYNLGNELRVMAFNRDNGDVIINDLYELKQGKVELGLIAGYIDFYFIAHEKYGGVDFVKQLNKIKNSSQVKELRENKIPNYMVQSGTDKVTQDFEGNKIEGLLAYGIYPNVRVAYPDGHDVNSDGIPIIPFPENKGEVKLSRGMAKVKIRIRRNTLDEEVKCSIDKIELNNIRKFGTALSSGEFTPTSDKDDFVDYNLDFGTIDYTLDKMVLGEVTCYVPEFILERYSDFSPMITVEGKGFDEVNTPITNKENTGVDKFQTLKGKPGVVGYTPSDDKPYDRRSLFRNVYYNIDLILGGDDGLSLDTEVGDWEDIHNTDHFGTYNPEKDDVILDVFEFSTLNRRPVIDKEKNELKMGFRFTQPEGSKWSIKQGDGYHFPIKKGKRTGRVERDGEINYITFKFNDKTTDKNPPMSTPLTFFLDGKNVPLEKVTVMKKNGLTGELEPIPLLDYLHKINDEKDKTITIYREK